jgi:type I restriction enzyme S subunit
MGALFAIDFVSDQEMGRVRLDESELHQNVLLDGDLLFGRRSIVEAGAGKCSLVVRPRTNLTFESSVIRVRLQERADPRFYYFYFRSPIGRDRMRPIVCGTNVKGIRGSDLSRLAVPLPAPTEQRAISTALTDVDSLLGALEKLVAKKRDLKQAAMQQLLTGKRRLPGFYGGWASKALGDIAAADKGSQLNSSRTTTGGRFAHLNGGMSPSGYTDQFNALGDTIAVSEGGNSCGYVQFMPEPYWCGGHCYSVVPKDIDNRFLYHALKGEEPRIMALRVGSGLPNVQKTALLAFQVRCPETSEEQSAIATALSDMDAEITAVEARLAKTRDLKQGMMQELLTGRTRLI